MAAHTIGIVIEGASGRLGTTQHLRSLMAIRAEGGLPLDGGDRLVPELVLLGRDPTRLAALAAASGGLKWSTERDGCFPTPVSGFIAMPVLPAHELSAPARRSM